MAGPAGPPTTALLLWEHVVVVDRHFLLFIYVVCSLS